MNTTNILGVAVLGWLLISPTQMQTTEIQHKKQIVYVHVPSKTQGCGCDVCDDCSCVESKTCTSCKEAAVDDTAANFPRPRKPCPGGPGRR